MNTHWSQRGEAGGRWAIRALIAVALRLGRGCARVVAYPSTLYVYLCRGPERRASRVFLTRAFGRPATALQVMRHIWTYGVTMFDRLFMLVDSLRRFDIRVHGLEQLKAQLAQGRGVLLIGAHVGSFEVLRALADERPDLRVRMVMDRRQTPALTERLHELNATAAEAVIDAGAEPVNVALAIREAAAEGALICLLADRARRDEATCAARFFGASAPFPVAPYLIASTLGLPVVLGFGLYRGGNCYDLYFETFAERLTIPRHERKQQLEETTQRYANRLEHYTRIDPYNWFNFYDFWHRPAGARTDGGASAADVA